MKLVPDRPHYDTTLALEELIIAVRASDDILENEKASRANLRQALGLINHLFKDLDVHLVDGAPLPEVWQLHRKDVSESASDNVLKVGVAAAIKRIREGDTAGAARILDACQIAADLFTEVG